METETERIARGLRRRDPDLLDALVEQYQHRLYRFLLHFANNRALAEDAFQETWLRVVERGSQYDSRWKFETWLLAIARNLVIDLARRRREFSLDEAAAAGSESEVSALDLLASPEPGPFEQMAGGERSARMAGVLGHLPAYYREALALRFYEDLQLEEIARVTGAPLSTVKARLRRGLELLRDRIERESR